VIYIYLRHIRIQKLLRAEAVDGFLLAEIAAFYSNRIGFVAVWKFCNVSYAIAGFYSCTALGDAGEDSKGNVGSNHFDAGVLG
jgi:hypothetical protein